VVSSQVCTIEEEAATATTATSGTAATSGTGGSHQRSSNTSTTHGIGLVLPRELEDLDMKQLAAFMKW
jgi:hypothetical protein